MATGSSSRDVTLTLSVDTLGSDGIKQLQSQFAALAKEGSAAGPEFQQLADQIARLGDQTQALESFKQLATVTDELRAGQAAAGFAIDATATKLTELKAASEQSTAAQKAAVASIDEARKANIDLSLAVTKLKSENDDAAKQTDEYKAKLNSLKEAIAENNKAIVDGRTAQRSATAELSKTSAEITKLTASYNAQADALDKSAAAVRQQEHALVSAGAAAEALGVSTKDVASAEAGLIATFNQGTAAIQNTVTASERLEAFQRSLTVIFAQQAAAAEKLVRAEQALAEEQRVVAASSEAMANAAKAAADKIDNAFRTVGARSAEELRAEITQVRAAMQTLQASSVSTGTSLKGAFDAGNAKIKSLERDLRELNGTLTTGDKVAKLFANSMGQITAGNVIADGVGYLVNKVKEMGREFIQVNLESQRLTKALTQIYGSAKVAAEQFEFLRATTNKSGISIRDVSDAFLRFSAAAKTSGTSLAAANGVFAQVANAAGILGLKGEQVTGVLEALGQMASKGAVSLEELRGQLGDRLPGALGIAANGLGVTQEELLKLVESGTLATSVFFPAFERGLEQAFGKGAAKVEGFIQGWNRLTNAIVKAAQAASEGSAFTNLGKAFDFVATNLNTVVKGLELLAARFAILKIASAVTSFLSLGDATRKAAVDITVATTATELNTKATVVNTEATKLSAAAKAQNAVAWGSLGAQIGATAGNLDRGTKAIEATTVASRAATAAKTALGGAMNVVGGAARGLMGALGGPVGALLTLALYAKEAGVAIGELAAKMFGWGKVLEANEKQIAALAEKERVASEARRRATAEQDLANVKAASASVAAVKQAELAVITSEKETQAKILKVKATQDLINLQGSEVDGLTALALASVEVSLAAQKELLAKEALVAASQAEIAAINKTLSSTGQLTTAQKEQISKLEELTKTRTAEVEKQQETVRQLQVESAERRIAAELLKDNSGRLTELNAAYDNAKAKVDILRLAYAQGAATAKQLRDAEVDLAVVIRLKNDAVDDSVAKLDRKGRAEQASLAITLATLNGQKAHYEAMIKSAEAAGDYGLKIYAMIEAKKVERAILETTIKVKQQELDTDKAKLEVELASIKGTDDASLAKKEDLRIRLELIKAKQIELGITKEGLKALDEEIRNLIAGKNAKDNNNKSSREAASALSAEAQARNANSAAIEAENASIERLNAAKQKSIDLENQRLGQDRDHFATDKNGQKLVAGSDLGTATGIFKFLQEAGVKDEAQARAITREFLDSQGNVQYANNSGVLKYGGSTISDALFKAAEKITFGGGAGGGGGLNGYAGAGTAPPTASLPPTVSQQPGPVTQQAGSTPQASPTATNLTINLAAGVNINSRADVEKLARAIMPAVNSLQRRGLSNG